MECVTCIFYLKKKKQWLQADCVSDVNECFTHFYLSQTKFWKQTINAINRISAKTKNINTKQLKCIYFIFLLNIIIFDFIFLFSFQSKHKL